jgi:hypothetical protein
VEEDREGEGGEGDGEGGEEGLNLDQRIKPLALKNLDNFELIHSVISRV